MRSASRHRAYHGVHTAEMTSPDPSPEREEQSEKCDTVRFCRSVFLVVPLILTSAIVWSLVAFDRYHDVTDVNAVRRNSTTSDCRSVPAPLVEFSEPNPNLMDFSASLSNEDVDAVFLYVHLQYNSTGIDYKPGCTQDDPPVALVWTLMRKTSGFVKAYLSTGEVVTFGRLKSRIRRLHSMPLNITVVDESCWQLLEFADRALELSRLISNVTDSALSLNAASAPSSLGEWETCYKSYGMTAIPLKRWYHYTGMLTWSFWPFVGEFVYSCCSEDRCAASSMSKMVNAVWVVLVLLTWLPIYKALPFLHASIRLIGTWGEEFKDGPQHALESTDGECDDYTKLLQKKLDKTHFRRRLRASANKEFLPFLVLQEYRNPPDKFNENLSRALPRLEEVPHFMSFSVVFSQIFKGHDGKTLWLLNGLKFIAVVLISICLPMAAIYLSDLALDQVHSNDRSFCSILNSRRKYFISMSVILALYGLIIFFLGTHHLENVLAPSVNIYAERSRVTLAREIVDSIATGIEKMPCHDTERETVNSSATGIELMAVNDGQNTSDHKPLLMPLVIWLCFRGADVFRLLGFIIITILRAAELILPASLDRKQPESESETEKSERSRGRHCQLLLIPLLIINFLTLFFAIFTTVPFTFWGLFASFYSHPNETTFATIMFVSIYREARKVLTDYYNPLITLRKLQLEQFLKELKYDENRVLIMDNVMSTWKRLNGNYKEACLAMVSERPLMHLILQPKKEGRKWWSMFVTKDVMQTTPRLGPLDGNAANKTDLLKRFLQWRLVSSVMRFFVVLLFQLLYIITLVAFGFTAPGSSKSSKVLLENNVLIELAVLAIFIYWRSATEQQDQYTVELVWKAVLKENTTPPANQLFQQTNPASQPT